MSYIINYILENNFLYKDLNTGTKILHLYNERIYDRNEWYNILYIPLEKNIYDQLKVLCDCKLFLNITFFTIIKKENKIETFEKIKFQINKKTFVKFLFDIDLLTEKFVNYFLEKELID